MSVLELQAHYRIVASPEWSDNKVSRHFECRRCRMVLVTPLSMPVEGNIEVCLRAHLEDEHAGVLAERAS